MTPMTLTPDRRTTVNPTFALVLGARTLHRLPGGAGWRWRSCGRYWLAVQK
jgi:hypothetical protein